MKRINVDKLADKNSSDQLSGAARTGARRPVTSIRPGANEDDDERHPYEQHTADVHAPVAVRESSIALWQRPGSGLHDTIVVANQPRSPKAEALRKIVSRLLLARDGKKIDPLAVCSVDQGDGRSFVAANLAVLFAQAGKRTLLIDADFRRAQQHALFSVPAGPGLAELLMGESNWNAIRQIEAVPNLFLLPFGQHEGNALELLASDVFSEVFARLVDICDVVLVDTPAGDEYVDAQVIAQQIGAAVLVIRQNKTALSKVRDLNDTLSKAGVNMLGVIINQV